MALQSPNSDRVRAALRLGWVFAEVYGRNRIGPHDPRLVESSAIGPDQGELPLSIERSPDERRIEAQGVLQALVQDEIWGREHVSLNPPANDLVSGLAAGATTTAGEQLDYLAKALYTARKTGPGTDEWKVLKEYLYKWDAHIQDQMAAGAFGTSSAYQLGRGLAETYWALDPGGPLQESGNWQWVLGTRRCGALVTLTERLATYLPDGAAEALTASLTQWKDVAASDRWRSDSRKAMSYLGHQVEVWRDLLLTGLDPRTVLASDTRIKRARSSLRIIGSFVPELALTITAIAVIGAAVFLFTLKLPALGTALSVLGTVGVTGAGVVAALKTTAQDLISQLRDAAYTDMLKLAATFIPPKPGKANPSPASAAVGTPLIEGLLDEDAQTQSAETPEPQPP